ncbi:hypothetical protein Y900_005120 [Mycolicibacterium aromaticivorans JS19b1 = JCM 16368]|uniref:Uncharacterized protein n=2 Tax=Mycolicibacterium aromaticivorans TaxID=318425 RepID=A0A064CHV0_9MYCO|nr:hypothetical protein Y900_005120 [Mycolicibacterium aromaticivorans JS19b1 = JCM 16368]
MEIAMMWSAWDSLADYGPLFTPIAAGIGAAVHVWRVRPCPPGRPSEIVLLWLFGGVVGIGGLVVTISHVFFAQSTAQQIGFPAGNPFQFEVGMANLAFALLGLACIWIRERFWEATAAGFAVFYWGAAVGHFIELFGHGDNAPYNAGPILVTDVGLPALILIALANLRHTQRLSGRTEDDQR